MLDAFYRAVLPAQGVYALFDGQRKLHHWCETLDDLTRETEARGHKPDLYFATASFVEGTEQRLIENALFRRAFCFDIDAGPTKLAKIEARIAAGKAPESARASIYLTRDDALRALVAWCQASRLVPTYIIASGAGLHVYFALDRDVPIDEWQPVATALKLKALAEGLRIDGGITIDPVRILRPIGTLHNNGERVAVLKHLPVVHPLEAVRAAVAGFVAPPKVERQRRLNDDILEAPVGPPKTLAKVGERCAAMAHAMQARGDIVEPYWRAMLGVIKFTIEGDDAAHAYSEGHPEYDYDATQQKIDRWTAGPTSCATFEQENPQACAGCRYRGKVKSPIMLGQMTDPEIRAAGLPEVGAPAPAAAPALASVAAEQETSFGDAFGDQDDDDGSLSTAQETPTPKGSTPWASHLPETFRVLQGREGAFMAQKRPVKSKNEADEEITLQVDVPFTNAPFWFESWAEGTSDADQAAAVYCVYNEARGSTQRFTFPARAMSARKEIFTALAAQNVQVYPNTPIARDAMEDYVRAAVERIRQAGQRQKIAERFGTNFDPKGNVIVAQGRHIIARDGSIVEGVVQDKLKARGSAYRVALSDASAGRWGPEVWPEIKARAARHIAYLDEFYSDPNFAPYQLAIMLAWGSPMLAFMQGGFQPGTPLPGMGLTVSLYSPRSGIGKSNAMHAAALAFGTPSAVVLQLDRTNATDNARQALLLQAGTMPSFMDEMEDVPAGDLAALISSVGNGASKQRMNKDLSLVGGVTTALVNVMSTNKSHRELVAADRNESAAVQMRMLEIECSGVQPVTKERAEQETAARAALHDCAGAVGALVHLAMCKMGAEQLNSLGLECAATARAKLDGKQDGRFMWRALGAMLAVRRILKSMGLQVFEGEALVREFKHWHDAGYQFASDTILPSDGPELLSLMLSDMSGKTLITRMDSGGRDKGDIPLNDRVPEDAVARSVLDGRYVYVKTDAIREWAAKRKISVQQVMAAGKRVDAFEPVDLDKPANLAHKVDIFRGTRLSQGVRSSVVKVRIDALSGVDYDAQMGDNVRVLRETRRAEADLAAAAVKDAT